MIVSVTVADRVPDWASENDRVCECVRDLVRRFDSDRVIDRSCVCVRDCVPDFVADAVRVAE